MSRPLGFGKYGDLPLNEVPSEYLEWLVRNSAERIVQCREELSRRELAEAANSSMIEQIVKAGFRDLAKKHHPDNGGSTTGMQELNAAFEKLKELIR